MTDLLLEVETGLAADILDHANLSSAFLKQSRTRVIVHGKL